MKYQLFISQAFDASDKVLLSASPELVTEADGKAWFEENVAKVPVGYRYQVVDSNHAWFDNSVGTDTTVEPKVDTITPLSIEQVLQMTKQRELDDRKAKFRRQEKLDEYLSNFPG